MEFFKEILINYGIGEEASIYVATIIILLLVTLLCIVANFVTKKFVLRIVTHLVKKTKTNWDNILLENKVFHRLSHIVPAIIIYYFASSVPDDAK